MKVITCTGFYGTGSSAITDIFLDCECVECKGDYEVRVLHDPYGISDSAAARHAPQKNLFTRQHLSKHRE